jgi:hypothetical protein
VFEPPSGFAAVAITRNKPIVFFFALALTVAGIAAGLLRTPTYEASATLQVGQVNPNSPGFLGYEQSASSLATAFSRAIDAGPVLAQVERKLGVSAMDAVQRLSSEPIPLSPAFRVIATGPSAEAARRLANVAAAGVVAYEVKANSANPQARSLLTGYREATAALRRAEAEVESHAQDPGQQKLIFAEAKRNAAKVKLHGIETAYVAAVASQPPREGLVTVLAGATSASNDRRSKIQLYAFLGLLLGIAVGCLVAVRWERRFVAPG